MLENAPESCNGLPSDVKVVSTEIEDISIYVYIETSNNVENPNSDDVDKDSATEYTDTSDNDDSSSSSGGECSGWDFFKCVAEAIVDVGTAVAGGVTAGAVGSVSGSVHSGSNIARNADRLSDAYDNAQDLVDTVEDFYDLYQSLEGMECKADDWICLGHLVAYINQFIVFFISNTTFCIVS